MIVGLIGISMPVFWLGEVVNLITQSRLHDTVLFSWVPPLGYTPFTRIAVGWFKSLLFPWLTLSILYIGIYARVLRSAIVEAQEEDFVRTARAKGSAERRVLLRHVLRTSLIGFVCLFGLDFGALVGGGALLTEVVFGLHGVGLAHVRLAAEPRPAGDPRDRDVRGVLRRRSRTRSSTSSTPGSTRGCADCLSRCSRCATCASRSGPRTASCARSTASRSTLAAGRGARHRRRVRLRQERHA